MGRQHGRAPSVETLRFSVLKDSTIHREKGRNGEPEQGTDHYLHMKGG